MEPNKILSARLIDLVFDGRDKEYGAFYLRDTYPRRIKKALLFTAAVTAMAFGGAALANSFKKSDPTYKIHEGVILSEVPPMKEPEKIPEPKKQPDPEPPRTEKFTPPTIKPDDEVIQPPPSLDDLDSARIGDFKAAGRVDISISMSPQVPDGDPNGIIQPKERSEPAGPRETVDIPAKFDGNWIRFLEKNLNAEVPVDNGAPAGRYSVVVQFVVDKQGNVSEIKPLTSHGYGVEQEAVRVLKKAPQWKPAIFDGYPVVAYHKQIIVFEVTE